MKRLFTINPLMRATAVFAVVVAAVAGTTYAALQSQATLFNNTISTATAQLQVKSAGSFASQDAGFVFSGAVPGGAAVPAAGHAFQLKNNGSVALNITASIPTAPTFTVLPSGSVDLSKVDMVLACTNGTQNFDLTSDVAALVAAHATGGVALTPDALPSSVDNIASCTAKVQMDADAFSGESASSTNFNIVFTGTPVTL